MKDIDKELDEILDRFDDWAEWCYSEDTMPTMPEEYPQITAKQAIKQLINQARIEAYNDIKNFATALDKGIISYESIVENRLKELKGGINE